MNNQTFILKIINNELKLLPLKNEIKRIRKKRKGGIEDGEIIKAITKQR